MTIDQTKTVGELTPRELYLYILTLLVENERVEETKANDLMMKLKNDEELSYEDRIFMNESIDLLKEFLFVDNEAVESNVENGSEESANVSDTEEIPPKEDPPPASESIKETPEEEIDENPSEEAGSESDE